MSSGPSFVEIEKSLLVLQLFLKAKGMRNCAFPLIYSSWACSEREQSRPTLPFRHV